MRRPRALLWLAAVLVVGQASALVRSYSVEPTCAEWSGWTGFRDTVGQQITCNFDHLDSASGGYVQLFAGLGGSGGYYNLDIYEADNGPRVAFCHDVVPGRDYDWVTFDGIEMELGKTFTKGRQYVCRFSRSGPDSIEYFWDRADPYPNPYGWMELGGDQPPPQSSDDLCMKLFGVLDPADSTYWAAYPYFPFGGERWGLSNATWLSRAREAGLRRARFRVAWTWVDSAKGEGWHFDEGLDTQYVYLRDSLGCEVYCNPYSCTESTSTRRDSSWEVTTSSWRYTMSVDCPPRNMSLPIDSSHNYWARFIEKTVNYFDALGLQSNGIEGT